MRDTIAWSYELLTPANQAVFRHLAVFVGGFTIEAAATVLDAPTHDGPDALVGVMELVNQSLLSRSVGPEDRPRFRMLETVRAFALEQLSRSSEDADIRRRHGEYFAGFVEAVAAPLYANPVPALAQVHTEQDNLRAAMSWAHAHGEPTTLIRIAAALVPYWHTSGQFREGREWLDRALASSADVAVRLRATVLREAGSLVRLQGDHERAEILGQESETLWRELGDPCGLAQALVLRGHVAEDQGRLDRSLAFHEEALGLLEPTNERFWTAIVHRHAGWLSLLRGDLVAAERHLQDALSRFRQEANPYGSAIALSTLGELAYQRGEFARAAALKQEWLRQTWDVWGLRNCLESLPKIAVACGQSERAARLLGAAEAYRERLGITLVPNVLTRSEHPIAIVRAGLGDAAFAAAWEEGRAQSLEQVVTEASALDAEPAMTVASHLDPS